MAATWREERRNRGRVVKGMCHRITCCKGYERRECVHKSKKRFKEQYFPDNSDVWIKDLDVE